MRPPGFLMILFLFLFGFFLAVIAPVRSIFFKQESLPVDLYVTDALALGPFDLYPLGNPSSGACPLWNRNHRLSNKTHSLTFFLGFHI